MREVQETSLHLDVVAKVRRGGTGLGRASDLHQGSRRLPGSKLIVPGAEAHTTSHEPVRSEDELRRTAFGVGNRRVREVFKAGLVNTLNRQRSEELRPLAVNPAWCVRELRDLRPGQTDPIRGACKRASACCEAGNGRPTACLHAPRSLLREKRQQASRTAALVPMRDHAHNDRLTYRHIDAPAL